MHMFVDGAHNHTNLDSKSTMRLDDMNYMFCENVEIKVCAVLMLTNSHQTC